MSKKEPLKIKLNNSKKISRKGIDSLQKKENIILPIDYIEFLINYNSNEVFKNYFILENNDNDFPDSFYITKIYTLNDLKYNSKSDFLYLDENSEYLFIAECEDIGQLSLKIKDEDKYSIFYSELTHTDKFIKIAENFTDFINGFSYPFANELEEFCYYPNTNKLLEIIKNKDLSVYKDYYRDSFADFIFEGNLNNDALFIILEALFNSGYSIKGYMNYIINRKDVKLLELCVKNGENINEKDNFNDSLINLAVRNLDLETIKFLLRNKIDLNTKNNNNETTIDLILDKKKNDKYLNEENLSKCDEILELLNNYLN